MILDIISEMKKIVYLLLILPLFAQSQIDSLDTDDSDVEYIIIEGDSIPHTAINLDEVLLLHKLKFDSKEDRKRYLILRRKTIKVYPYAKLAADRLESLNERIDHIKKKSDQKKYAKLIQRYIEDEFAEELKQLTRTEGQILVKLIYRQTGETTFDLIKRLRSGWRAFWFNSTANLFNISLKETFDPENNKEDYLIEDILQRNFQSGLLERQDAAIKFDFLELTEKWLK
ncbi:uncharacterized protein DUF4294 [Xanthomarina spongicola]|uniref:Uncharacterized protein DUF4294 n=2 Tax=Xanthomarina spongicola TaxID=570520 RepID=A0A316DGI7_9FLAO|nr:uncharacterized protein DUF4294 [Xanthomarina spongicola]